MKYSEKSRDYSIQYAKDKLKRVPLDLTKEKYTELQAVAAAAGETVNGFIKKAIDERIAREARNTAGDGNGISSCVTAD